MRRTEVAISCVRIFIGVRDLRQLPPVKQPWIFEPTTPRCRSALGISSDDKIWKTHVKLLEIPGSMRQQGDSSFLDCLNYIGERRKDDPIPDQFRTMLESRIPVARGGTLPMREYPSPLWDTSVHMFATNIEVDNQNDEIIDRKALAPGARRVNIRAHH